MHIFHKGNLYIVIRAVSVTTSFANMINLIYRKTLLHFIVLLPVVKN